LSIGYLYSWVYVTNNASILCPDPWRVPSSNDFCTLDKSLFGRSTCTNRATYEFSPYHTQWGGSNGGFASANGVVSAYDYVYYWSSSSYNGQYAYFLDYHGEHVYPQRYDSKAFGFRVRCVK
jgi:uncharacterized protein (TIGR02145 family)